MIFIKASDINTIKPFVKKLRIPRPDSHKGQNGRVLIIGGSTLFHAASIWAAEIASHFADIVHYSSTKENNEIFLSLKKKFHNGIIVSRKDMVDYVKEDDAVLVGPGMIRSEKEIKNYESAIMNYEAILKIKDEAEFTYCLTKYLIENFPNKKFVFDAGVLQMAEKEWFSKLTQPAIITPHQKEFERLFGQSIGRLDLEDKTALVEEMASRYKLVILLKAIDDIISDGKTTYVVKGGNQGLTKGGTGDLLAGLTVSLYSKNEPIVSAVLASYLLKVGAETLYPKYRYWYNIDNMIEAVVQSLSEMTKTD